MEASQEMLDLEQTASLPQVLPVLDQTDDFQQPGCCGAKVLQTTGQVPDDNCVHLCAHFWSVLSQGCCLSFPGAEVVGRAASDNVGVVAANAAGQPSNYPVDYCPGCGACGVCDCGTCDCGTCCDCCGTCDCGACDCGTCDCGTCDCGALDCGDCGQCCGEVCTGCLAECVLGCFTGCCE